MELRYSIMVSLILNKDNEVWKFEYFFVLVIF